MSANGGITKGKSHKEGGIPMVVKSTGQHVELEGGEGVINKRNMASTKTYDFQGKKLTACEVASEINSADGNGVKISCNEVVGKEYEFGNGGNVLNKSQQKEFDRWMADGNVIQNEDETYSTQDAQYTNKLKDLKALKQYFHKEFIGGNYAGGGNIKTFGDAVLFKGKTWFVTNKNGELGIGNMSHGAWGSDYPFIELSKLDLSEVTDMNGNDVTIVEGEEEYKGGGKLPNEDKLFHLPIEMSVYVPSTQDVDKVISDSEMKNRVTEVSKYLANLFGGFTRSDKVGGYLSTKSEVIVEDVAPVTAFATKGDFDKHKTELISKLSEWARKWGQEAIGFEYEGDLYYVGQEFKNGGNVLAEATKLELDEHKGTINEFKREDVKPIDVAESIAKDHLKENKQYYNYLRVMEREMNSGSGEEVYMALHEYDKLLHRKRNKKKFALGGAVNKESIHLIVNEDFKPSLFQLNSGRYVGDSVLRKNELNHLYFVGNDGYSSTFIYPRTEYYFVVPNSIIDVKGYSRRYEGGGDVKSYGGLKNSLSENDILILDTLRSVPIEKLTHYDLEFISTFRGTNVVNSLSTNLISKLFGLMFKYHTIANPIKNLLISNCGTGNLLNLAPTYLESVLVDFIDNDFKLIEQQICFAQNRGKEILFEGSYKDISAIIHVYPTTNPNQEELFAKMSENKQGMIVVGVAEFNGQREFMEFKKQVTNDRSRNRILSLYDINNGITERGDKTLIYILNTK